MDENDNRPVNKKDEILFLPDSDSKHNPASLRFGWGKFRPNCLQFLNSPKWFLACVILYTLCQGVTLIGLLNMTLPSIEKRFSLSAKEMGFIAASNDISALLVVVFVSYYGDYGNKIKWIGGGGVVLGIGILLYSLPHFLIGMYEPITLKGSRGLCMSGGIPGKTQINCILESGRQWYYLAIFIVSQLISGAGISPYYSLLPAYLDENVHPKSLPVYLGIWMCATFLGPGLGFAVSGKLLSIYVDLEQPEGINLTARDPRWIGAWWLGFLVFGSLILLASFLVLGFPRELPGAKELRQQQIKKGNLKKANNMHKPSLKKLLPELKALLTNWTFLFNTLGLTTTLLFVGALTPFLPKILQLKFGFKPEDIGYMLAAMFTPSMAVGIIFGSLVLKCFSLKQIVKKAAMFIFIVRLIGILSALAFLVPGCNNVMLAGVNSLYNNTITSGQVQVSHTVQKLSLTAPCNQNCGCSKSRFAPVCGSDKITYFDKCHAGCAVQFPNMTFSNCSCIPPQVPGAKHGTAKFGYCDRDCKNFILFIVMIAIDTIMQFAKVVPDKTVILRCVPDNKRAFAHGIQYVSIKTLGYFAGPILFGYMVDSYCTVWQDICGGEKGRCFDYDIENLSYAVCIMGCVITFFSALFHFLSWYFYKPEQVDEKEAVDLRDQAGDVVDRNERETKL